MAAPPPQELSEEALLRSQCQTSDDRGMETECQANDMSQVSREKEKERLWKRTQRYILAIGIECESILSRHFRSSDPIRNEVVEAVQGQTRLAWESVKMVLDHLLAEPSQNAPQSDIEEGVFDILRVAQLTTTSQLEQCLDTKLEVEARMRALCARLGCQSVEALENEVATISETLKAKGNLISELQKELHHKQLQVSELADRIRQMGTNVPAHGNLSEVDLSRLEEWDGHLLLAVAHAKLRPRREPAPHMWGIGEYPIPRESGSEREQQTNNAFIEYMKTSSLPELQPFRAREKESFKRFINSFLVKYPKRLWDDKSLIQLLEGMLRKDALTIFETLPHSVKAGTFDDVVRAMQDRLKEDDNNACVKAMTTLRKLAIRDGQSVSEFCLVLEKMANKAFPDSPPVCTSLQKAEILFNQLAHWEGSYVLSEALEKANRKEAYEKVKEAALRLERTRKRANEMNQGRSVAGSERHRMRENMLPHKEVGDVRRTEARAGAYNSPGERNRLQRSDTDKNGVGNSENDVKCYRCGRKGHVARWCTSAGSTPVGTGTGAPRRAAAVEVEAHGSFSALLDQILCTTTHSMGCERSKGGLFGEKSVYPVKMMGLDLTALLDTGSEASIVPLGVFKRAREKKVDVDAHVKRIPGVNAIVRNASGEVMKFVDTIRMDVTLDGETRSVGFHVGDGLDNLVLLGTNALAAFGITLGKVRSLGTTETVESCNNTAAIQSSQTSESKEVSSGGESGEVRVQGRVFIPPGYVKFVPLAVDTTKEEVLFESSNEAFSRGICRVSADKGTV